MSLNEVKGLIKKSPSKVGRAMKRKGKVLHYAEPSFRMTTLRARRSCDALS